MTKHQYAKFLEALDEYLGIYGAYPDNRGDFKAGFGFAWRYLTGAKKRNDKRVMKEIKKDRKKRNKRCQEK